jgi:hypothetical protein
MSFSCSVTRARAERKIPRANATGTHGCYHIPSKGCDILLTERHAMRNCWLNPSCDVKLQKCAGEHSAATEVGLARKILPKLEKEGSKIEEMRGTRTLGQ